MIRYRRFGAGQPVLLLQASARLTPLSEVAECLGADYRVIAPDLPANAADITARLASFLEGVGVSGLRVVAVGDFCLPALEMVLSAPDQVARLILVPDRWQGADRPLEGSLGTAVRRSPVPLLIVPRAQATDLVQPLVRSFLQGSVAESA